MISTAAFGTSTGYGNSDIREPGVKTLLLVSALALLLAACGGTSPAEWTSVAAIDATPPSRPTGLAAAATGSSAINLSWNASTDNVGVTGYVVRRAGTQVGASGATSFTDTGLSGATTYSYTVAAVDAAGNISPNSTSASATTASGGTGDTTPPTTPAGLTATATGTSTIDLSWNASTDNVGVTGYVVRRNGTQVATPATSNFSDSGLSPGTTYRYTVAAVDAAGNNSSLSTSASATTSGTAPPVIIPPTLGLWFQIPNTQLRSVCAGDHGFPEVRGNTGCSAVTGAWGGGVLDTARNRLIIWGGGHTDYAGNEVYALDLDTLTLERLTDPSTPVRDACSSGGVYADGKPSSRHTYNHVAYLPNQDAMFAWGGSQYQCGGSPADGWFFNLANLSWTKKSSTNGPGGGTFNNAAAYDPNNDLVYMHDWNDLRSFNPATNTWTKRSSAQISAGNALAAVVDPVRKKYFFSVSGSTTLRWYDISSATASVPPQSAATTGCGGFLGDANTGIEYDPVQDRIVGWNGGNTVYLLNPDTFSCTTVTTTGGPAAAQQGTFGRFRYVPSLNLFVTCNSVDANCFTLRLTP